MIEEDLFRTIYHHIDTPLFVIDANGDDDFIFRAANPAYCRAVGLTPEAIVGRRPEEVSGLTMECVAALRQHCLHCRAEGRVVQYETFMEGSGCVSRWLTSLTPLADEAGKIERIIGAAVNITERTRMEKILPARLRLWELAGTHSMDELLTAALDEVEALTGSTFGFYQLLEADQKTVSLSSWSTGTLKNTCTAAGKVSHYNVSPAGIWTDCIAERRPVIHNDYSSPPHCKGLPEGHTPVVREVVVPIIRGDLIKAIIGIGNKPADYNWCDVEIALQLGDMAWDIVEQKMAAQTIRSEKKFCQTVLNSISDGVSVINLKDYLITSMNEAFLRLFGRSQEEVIGKPCYEVIPHRTEPCDSADFPCPVRLTVNLGGSHTVEHVYRQANGEETLIENTTSPITDHTGRKVQVVSISRNITERKRSEEELAQRSQELRETNVALKVLLKQREEDQQVLNDRVWHNIKKMILPHLNTLKQSGLSSEQRAQADLIAHRLQNITSGLGRGLADCGLTPREMEVASHVVDGKTSKEIADLICLSPKTVEVHRHGIRKKLGLIGKQVNLRSHLLSLTR